MRIRLLNKETKLSDMCMPISKLDDWETTEILNVKIKFIEIIDCPARHQRYRIKYMKIYD